MQALQRQYCDVVLLPKGYAAIRTAKANRLQSSLNLALGSALAGIGPFIPTLPQLRFTLTYC